MKIALIILACLAVAFMVVGFVGVKLLETM